MAMGRENRAKEKHGESMNAKEKTNGFSRTGRFKKDQSPV